MKGFHVCPECKCDFSERYLSAITISQACLTPNCSLTFKQQISAASHKVVGYSFCIKDFAVRVEFDRVIFHHSDKVSFTVPYFDIDFSKLDYYNNKFKSLLIFS